MTYEKHITVLSILYLGCGALVLASAFGVSLILLGSGFASEQLALSSGLAVAIGLFMLLLAVPALVGGWGLMRRKSWSRILVLVLGFLNLLSFPLGTALGIYTIWLLMQDQADSFFDGPSADSRPTSSGTP